MSEPLRREFHSELDQLRLQVELMGVRVDENLERMREVLHTGDARAGRDDDQGRRRDRRHERLAHRALLHRCWAGRRRWRPIFASWSRRCGSSASSSGSATWRCEWSRSSPSTSCSAPPSVPGTSSSPSPTRPLRPTARRLRAWSSQDVALAAEIASGNRPLDLYYERLVAELVRLDGPDAVRIAIGIFTGGRSLERIADHAVIVGARLRYLLTGEPAHLAAEIR